MADYLCLLAFDMEVHAACSCLTGAILPSASVSHVKCCLTLCCCILTWGMDSDATVSNSCMSLSTGSVDLLQLTAGALLQDISWEVCQESFLDGELAQPCSLQPKLKLPKTADSLRTACHHRLLQCRCRMLHAMNLRWSLIICPGSTLLWMEYAACPSPLLSWRG